MTHEEICTYEVCKLAKENGFDWESPMFYNPEGELKYGWAYDPMNSGVDMRDILCHNSKLPLGFGAECAAPTQSLLQNWLRDEKGYYVYPFFDNEELKWTYVVREKTGDMWIPLIGETPYYDCFDEAMEDVLKFTLENLV